jgi:hypothetical protein
MARGSDRGDGSARGAGAQKAKGQREKQNQGPGIRNQESGNYLQLAIYLGCFKRPDLAGSSTAALTHRRHRLHRPLCISTNYIPTTHTTHDTRHTTRHTDKTSSFATQRVLRSRFTTRGAARHVWHVDSTAARNRRRGQNAVHVQYAACMLDPWPSSPKRRYPLLTKAHRNHSHINIV